MEVIRILLVGSGGREHALAWKLSQSARVDVIYVVPGNGGSDDGLLTNVKNVKDVKADDFSSLMDFARKNKVNLIIPGPEAPLVEGIETSCRAAGIRCFGPSKQAARMEGSKTFSKDFMDRHHIPTAKYRNFGDYDDAKEYLQSVSHNVVLKASGLAAGKGVIMPSSKAEAQAALQSIMQQKEFGTAGDEVVIEEYLEGEELSFLTFSDGYTIRSLPPAQDHKQVHDGDQGPNTGGMGCYAPTKVATPELIETVHRTILQPTVDGMRKEGYPFVGLLFTGIMVTETGPKTLEYNVRFGDPETQTLLPLLSPDADLAQIMIACTDHYLDAVTIKILPAFSATVVACAGGYPGPYVRGDEIILGEPESSTMIFHAGTTKSSGVLKTSGGRVIAATSTASTLSEAIRRAYDGISTIKFARMHYRKDIGHRALSPSKSASSNLAAPSSAGPPRLTYASAGVSISSGNTLVNAIKPLVRSTARPGTDASIGGFGGLFDLSLAGYGPDSSLPSSDPRSTGSTSSTKPPILVGAIDGVGTKLKIAHASGIHHTVGIDLVAMNVNDLIVQGAEPLFFLDCYTTGSLSVEIAKDFISGVAEGCKQANCALIGGETAEMPGLFKTIARSEREDPSVYDAVGAAIGAIPAGRTILPNKPALQAGDVLIGIASSGLHSNGFSLVRKIIDRVGLHLDDPAPWLAPPYSSIQHSNSSNNKTPTIAESLLTPTKIYTRALLPLLLSPSNPLKALSHITGGGLLENIPRMLPPHLSATIDVRTYSSPLQPIFAWLKHEGHLDDVEFARVFNTGLGMVGVVGGGGGDVDGVLERLSSAGERVWRVGVLREREVEKGEGEGMDEGCVLVGTEAWH